MTLALPIRENPRESAAYLPIDQAAELTGLSLRHWRRIAEQQGPRGLAYKAPPAGGGKPVWHLHRSLDPRLRPGTEGADQRRKSSLLEHHRAPYVDLAYRKLHWLRKWRSAGSVGRARQSAAAIVEEAKRVDGPKFKVSFRSLQAWQCASAAGGLEALIPRYNGPRPDPSRDREGAVNPQSPRSSAAIDFFHALYRTQNHLSIAHCHEATVREAKREGWSWPASYSATAQWLRDYDDRSLTRLLRDGKDEWARRFLPHLEQDWDAVEPGEFFVCDHHQADFWVLYKDKPIRPWLTAVQDCRTRAIVGWHFGPSPHQDAILASLRMAFRDWAIPRVMRIDNGKDYTSRLITGLTKQDVRGLRREYGGEWKEVVRRTRNLVSCADARWLGITGELDIELIYAIPYSPWSKGTLERWFGTFEGRCGKTFATYTANTPVNRPECLPNLLGGADLQSLADSQTRVAEFIELYHHRPHRGLGGATPLAVWQTASRLRRAEENALLCLMDTRGVYKVTANGVAITVGGARLTYGASSTALNRWVDRKVLVMLDPAHLAECWALDPKARRLIARLEPNERMHPCATGQAARETIAEIKRDQSVMHKAARSAANRTRTMIDRMNRNQTAELAERRATGTDDATPAAAIVPVRTGFEGVSRSSRPAFDPAAYCSVDDVGDLFAPAPPLTDQDDDDDDLSALFAAPAAPDDPAEEGLEGLL